MEGTDLHHPKGACIPHSGLTTYSFNCFWWRLNFSSKIFEVNWSSFDIRLRGLTPFLSLLYLETGDKTVGLTTAGTAQRAELVGRVTVRWFTARKLAFRCCQISQPPSWFVRPSSSLRISTSSGEPFKIFWLFKLTFYEDGCKWTEIRYNMLHEGESILTSWLTIKFDNAFETWGVRLAGLTY